MPRPGAGWGTSGPAAAGSTAAGERAQLRRQAYESWRGELSRLVKALNSRSAQRREAALAEPAAIDDPLALPALYEVIAPLGPDFALGVLDFAKDVPGEVASLDLATAAFSPLWNRDPRRLRRYASVRHARATGSGDSQPSTDSLGACEKRNAGRSSGVYSVSPSTIRITPPTGTSVNVCVRSVTGQ